MSITIKETQLKEIRDAFRAGGNLDIAPEPHSLGGWEVSVNDDKGNCLASVIMPSEKQALGIIDLLVISIL